MQVEKNHFHNIGAKGGKSPFTSGTQILLRGTLTWSRLLVFELLLIADSASDDSSFTFPTPTPFKTILTDFWKLNIYVVCDKVFGVLTIKIIKF